MATMQGITGKLSGKMGSAVFRVRNGQQVVTQYNPIVANPNTKAQQEPRSKFKLLSQLAAVLSPGFGTLNVVRRPAKGTPSKRNAFMQINYPLVSYSTEDENGKATISMADIKLTSSSRYLGSISQSGTQVLLADIPEEVTAVRYCVVAYKDDKPVLIEQGEAAVSHGAATITPGDTHVASTILVFGIIPMEGASGTAYDPIMGDASEKPYTSSTDLEQLVSRGAIMETETIGIDYSTGA